MPYRPGGTKTRGYRGADGGMQGGNVAIVDDIGRVRLINL